MEEIRKHRKRKVTANNGKFFTRVLTATIPSSYLYLDVLVLVLAIAIVLAACTARSLIRLTLATNTEVRGTSPPNDDATRDPSETTNEKLK